VCATIKNKCWWFEKIVISLPFETIKKKHDMHQNIYHERIIATVKTPLTKKTFQDLAVLYKASDIQDNELLRLLGSEEFIGFLYNLYTGLFSKYKYNTIPYRQYIKNPEAYARIGILHQIHTNDIHTIKELFY
jgi:hypothetical protein